MKLTLHIILLLLSTVFSNFLTAQVQHLETIKDGYLESVRSVAVSPDDNFVYAAGEEGFAAYQRNTTTGQLIQIFATDTLNAEMLSISHSGKYLFMLRSNAIFTYERNLQNGFLTWISQTLDVSNGYNADIELTQNDAIIAISDDHHDRVHFYDFDTINGILSNPQTFTNWTDGNFLEGASGMSFSHDDEYLVVAPRAEIGITVFKKDTNGQYQIHQEIEDSTTNFNWYQPTDAIFTSDNKYLYVSTYDDITVFEQNTTTGFWEFKDYINGGLGTSSPFLQGVKSLRLSNDELSLFAITYYSDNLIRYNRDMTTGALSLPNILTDDNFGVDGLDEAYNFELSNDGQNIYVIAFEDDALSVFDFDTTSLILTYLEEHKGNSSNADALQNADAVVVSPDGKHVYSASKRDQGIAVFERDTTTGTLTFIQDYKFWEQGMWTGIIHNNYLSISPDGEHIYLSRFGVGLFRFKRNTTTGEISYIGNTNFPQGVVKIAPNGNYLVDVNNYENTISIYQKQAGQSGNVLLKSELHAFNDGIISLSDVVDFVISTDNRFVYAATSSSNTILVFEINPQTFQIQHLQTIENTDIPIDDMDYPYRLDLSFNENALYVTEHSKDKLFVFSRNATTGLIAFNHRIQNHKNGIAGIAEIRLIRTSPTDGKVFVVSKDSLAVFQAFQLNDTLHFIAAYSLLNIGANWGFSYSDIAFVNNGQHFYMVNQSDNAIFAFENQYYMDTIPLGSFSVSTIFIANNQLELKAFPNPTTDQINLEIKSDKPQKLTISIINNNGQTVLNQQFSESETKQIITFDLSDLSKGIYYLNVNGKVVKVLKL